MKLTKLLLFALSIGVLTLGAAFQNSQGCEPVDYLITLAGPPFNGSRYCVNTTLPNGMPIAAHLPRGARTVYGEVTAPPRIKARNTWPPLLLRVYKATWWSNARLDETGTWIHFWEGSGSNGWTTRDGHWFEVRNCNPPLPAAAEQNEATIAAEDRAIINAPPPPPPTPQSQTMTEGYNAGDFYNRVLGIINSSSASTLETYIDQVEDVYGVDLSPTAAGKTNAAVYNGAQSLGLTSSQVDNLYAAASTKLNSASKHLSEAPEDDEDHLQSEVALPEGFALDQNYPNPFNPSTAISFTIPDASFVRLTIYDLMGRQIATLVDGHLDAGTHVATWEGRSNNGRAVANGVYIYTLQAGGHAISKQMTLMK